MNQDKSKKNVQIKIRRNSLEARAISLQSLHVSFLLARFNQTEMDYFIVSFLTVLLGAQKEFVLKHMNQKVSGYTKIPVLDKTSKRLINVKTNFVFIVDVLVVELVQIHGI